MLVAAEVWEQAAVVAAEVREQAVVFDVVQGDASAVEVWEQTVVVVGMVWKAAVVAAVDLVRGQALTGMTVSFFFTCISMCFINPLPIVQVHPLHF